MEKLAGGMSEGLRSAFDPLGQAPFPGGRFRPIGLRKSTEQALWGDWYKVGQDFEEAHNRLGREIEDVKKHR